MTMENWLYYVRAVSAVCHFSFCLVLIYCFLVWELAWYIKSIWTTWSRISQFMATGQLHPILRKWCSLQKGKHWAPLLMFFSSIFYFYLSILYYWSTYLIQNCNFGHISLFYTQWISPYFDLQQLARYHKGR